MTRITGEWLTRAPTRAVIEMLEGAGKRALFVGGSVRDALLDRAVSDIDIATDALPDETLMLANKAGIKVVPTGLDHGTVTVVAEGIPHEVTTFRRDVSTDGRRAVVAFSSCLDDDAARRDFTINALYAMPNGMVLDPSGKGVADLKAGRVRFVGDAPSRIKEDYLRILRFFRFHAVFGDQETGFDGDDLAAISASIDGLDTLSRERVGDELRKLLGARNPAQAVATMAMIGVLARLLPGAMSECVAILVALEEEANEAPRWIRRLAALGGTQPEHALRLSKAEARDLHTLGLLVESQIPIVEVGYRHGAQAAIDTGLLRAAVTGTSLPVTARSDALRGAEAKFPVAAADLMPDLTGPALGRHLEALEARWVASGFTLSRAALLRD